MKCGEKDCESPDCGSMSGPGMARSLTAGSSTAGHSQLASFGNGFADAAKGLNEVEVRVELIEDRPYRRVIVGMAAVAEKRWLAIRARADEYSGFLGCQFARRNPYDWQVQ